MKNRLSALLICPEFYDYRSIVERELESLGYEVTSVKERPRRWLYSLVKRLFPKLLSKKFYDFYFNHYLSVLSKRYDLVFCIRGEVLSEKFLSNLRQKNKQARFIMYQWDSVKVTDYRRLLPYFDKVQSFDFEDCQNLNLEYLPLFFTEEYLLNEPKSDFDYDVVYIGSYNNDRYELLQKFKNEAASRGLKLKEHLYISRMDYIKLKVLKSKTPAKEDVKFYTIGRNDVIDLISKSRCILDIENKNQSGFTMRTFESLATGRLLLTTNKNIVDLNQMKANWMLLDRQSMKLTREVNQYVPEKPVGIESYSLKNWLNRILA